MKEKDLIKMATSDLLPDKARVINDCINKIENKEKRFSLKKLVPIGVSLALIMLTAAFLPNIVNNNFQINEKPRINNKGDISCYPPNEEIKGTNDDNIIINNLEDNGSISEASRRYFDPALYDTKKLTEDEVIKYLGCDLRPTELPENVKKCEGEPRFTTFIKKENKKIVYDRFEFRYSENYKKDYDGYDPLAKEVSVSFWKENGQSCCIYVDSKDLKKSVISGVEMFIGTRKMSYGPYDEKTHEPSGYYVLYIAQFEYNGINCEVVTDNLDLEEFHKLLSSMIKI